MKQLELNHLAPYLPYGLQTVNFNTNGLIDKPLISEMIPSKILSFCENSIESKIILRPLSDLTKEIEVNGEKFVPIDYFIGEDIDNVLNAAQINDLLYLPYNIILILLSWHFDVFGLIPKGLAVDINTLNIEK